MEGEWDPGVTGGGGRPSGFTLSTSVSNRGNFNRHFHEAICLWTPQISRHFFLKQSQEFLEESQLPRLSGPILKNKMSPPPKVTRGRRLSAVWKKCDGAKFYIRSWVIPEHGRWAHYVWYTVYQRASNWRMITWFSVQHLHLNSYVTFDNQLPSLCFIIFINKMRIIVPELSSFAKRWDISMRKNK